MCIFSLFLAYNKWKSGFEFKFFHMGELNNVRKLLTLDAYNVYFGYA